MVLPRLGVFLPRLYVNHTVCPHGLYGSPLQIKAVAHVFLGVHGIIPEEAARKETGLLKETGPVTHVWEMSVTSILNM